MERLYYSTGQVASQLGTSVATVRLLCETGAIQAETTPGGQWRIPASEVERVKPEGLPPIPRPLPIEAVPEDDEPELVTAASVAVLSAQDQVAITRSRLERRRIEREIEENEDWFREREREKAAAVAVERHEARAQLAEQQRQLWIRQWKKYGLDSVPYAVRNEFTIEVHAAVSAALKVLQTDEPEVITRRLVDAAVHRVLRPWQRKQDVQRALKSVMDRLPKDLQAKPEWASIKQHVWKAAVESVEKLPEEANYREMAATAEEAVEPWVVEYKHVEACRRTADNVYIYDDTSEETEAARKGVLEALIKLPVDTTGYALGRAKEAALAPYKAAIAQRKEAARLESEKQAKRRAATWRVESHLAHIEHYVRQAYVFDGGESDLRRELDRLRPVIRERLIEKLQGNPQMTDAQIRVEIKKLVDDD